MQYNEVLTIKSILITGASGYIGANLARYCVNCGMDVHIVIRPSTKLDLINDIKDRIKIHTFYGDTSELMNIVSVTAPDLIFHLAALFITEHKSTEIKPLIESNILFGTQILEAAVTAGVKYFINTGTHWQHYNTSEYCPSNLYSATKQAFENIARYYISAFDIRFVTLKLIDTYGPFDPRPKVLSILKRVAKSGERIGMTDGEQQLGFLYIEDVVKAFLLAAEYVKKMPTHSEKSFIVAPKEIYTLKQIIRIFEQAWDTKLNINFGERQYRKRELMRVCCADENILSNVDTIGLYDGFKKIIEAENKTKKN